MKIFQNTKEWAMPTRKEAQLRSQRRARRQRIWESNEDEEEENEEESDDEERPGAQQIPGPRLPSQLVDAPATTTTSHTSTNHGSPSSVPTLRAERVEPPVDAEVVDLATLMSSGGPHADGDQRLSGEARKLRVMVFRMTFLAVGIVLVAVVVAVTVVLTDGGDGGAGGDTLSNISPSDVPAATPSFPPTFDQADQHLTNPTITP